MAQEKKTNSPEAAEPARSRQKGQTQGKRAPQKKGSAQNTKAEQKGRKTAEKPAAPAKEKTPRSRRSGVRLPLPAAAGQAVTT